MQILIQGTPKFNKYEIFIHALGKVLRTKEEDDKQIIVYTLGPTNVNAMIHEFFNISERTLKSNGIRPKIIKVTRGWAKDNMSKLDHFIYLCNPKESLSELAEMADNKEKPDLGIFRY